MSAMYQIVVMFVGFIVPRIMLVNYGSEINGIVTSILQFVTYFNLVEAGLSGATVYALYKPLADEDHDAINGVVSAARGFYRQSGFIFLCLIIGLAAGFPYIGKATDLARIEIFALVLALGANGVFQFFTLGKYSAIVTADQRQYVVSFASVAYYAVNTLLIVLMARAKISVTATYSIAAVAVFARSLVLWVYCKRHYPYLDYKVTPNKKALDKRWSALYLQILGVTQRGIPVMLATVILNFQSVSIYSIYNMVISGILSVLDIFQSGLSASFGDIIARKETKKLQTVYQDFELTYYMLIAWVYGVAAALIVPFVMVYTKGITDADYYHPILGLLFVVNGFLYNLKTPQGMLVISAGLYRETRVQSTIQALIICLLGVTLTPTMGLQGILIALCLSNLYRTIDLLFFIPKHVTKLPFWVSLKRMLMAALGGCLICLPFTWMTIDVSGYGEWILNGLGISTYGFLVVVVIAAIFDRQRMRSVMRRIRSMVIKTSEKPNVNAN